MSSDQGSSCTEQYAGLCHTEVHNKEIMASPHFAFPSTSCLPGNILDFAFPELSHC